MVRDSVQALPRPAVAPVRVVEAEESDVADLVSVRSWFGFGEGRVGTEEEEEVEGRRRKRSKER